ncbi:hypothetical protein BGE01nite_55660 [Brevifollis gellanilyticus]|uniref:ATPase AAA-type core domain-containing protein n=2 Tax=Brevifollis gellanilyticus TaxID=748831 RepID=A0A512MHQ4_9BACT|nr:hypothetical protein BGE01nite_55660 [Brevifollis gellanilyticus]
MLTALQIENFKGFSKLNIESLARVNLIVGAGNSGKTSILEAIALLPQKGGFKLPQFRDPEFEGGSDREMWRWMTHNLSEDAVRVNGQGHDGPQIFELAAKDQVSNLAVKLRKVRDGRTISWHPSLWTHEMKTVTTKRVGSTALAKDYDRWTRRAENEDRFVEFLRALEPRLKSLRPMEHTDQRLLYADVGLPERIALPLLGEGFNRLVQIFGAIIGESADIILVDEIENGLHWTALPQVWGGIRAAIMKEEVQIFATTHSLECIAAAVEVFKGEPKNDLAVHRLERGQDGEIHCVTMGEDELERMLERNWEIR